MQNYNLRPELKAAIKDAFEDFKGNPYLQVCNRDMIEDRLLRMLMIELKESILNKIEGSNCNCDEKLDDLWTKFEELQKETKRDKEFLKTLIENEIQIITKELEKSSLFGAVLSKDLTCTRPVGGISNGQFYKKGTRLEQILIDLIAPATAQFPIFTNPSLVLNANKTTFEWKSQETLTITANFNRGTIVPDYGTSGFRAGRATGFQLNDGEIQESNVFEISVAQLNESQTFTVTVYFEEGEQPKDSFGENYDIPYSAGKLTKDLRITINKPQISNPVLKNPSVTITSDKSLLEKNSDDIVKFTVNFNRGSINPAYGTSGFRSGKATSYSINGGDPQDSNIFEFRAADLDTNLFTAKVTYGAGEQPKNNLGDNFGEPLPAGEVITATSLEIEIVPCLLANTGDITEVGKMTLMSRSAGEYVFAFPKQTRENPETFYMPSDWEVLSVETWNPITNQWASVAGDFDILDAEINGIAYKQYKDNRGGKAGARDIKVKWR